MNFKQKSRPIILEKIPYFGGRFLFSANKNISNYYVKRFFGDMRKIVDNVDLDVNYSQENLEASTLFGKIKQMKSSFYVCAYDFQIGDIMEEHKITFFKNRKYPFILDFDFEPNKCHGELVDSVWRNLWDLNYVDFNILGEGFPYSKESLEYPFFP